MRSNFKLSYEIVPIFRHHFLSKLMIETTFRKEFYDSFSLKSSIFVWNIEIIIILTNLLTVEFLTTAETVKQLRNKAKGKASLNQIMKKWFNKPIHIFEIKRTLIYGTFIKYAQSLSILFYDIVNSYWIKIRFIKMQPFFVVPCRITEQSIINKLKV